LLVLTSATGAGVGAGASVTLAVRSLGAGGAGGASRLTTGGGGGGGAAATFLWHPEVNATTEAPIVNISIFNLIESS